MTPPAVRAYVVNGLAGTPATLNAMLGALAPDDPMWDMRPDPVRFTLREMLAHLADWEPIWLERLRRTRDEDQPHLPGYDEGVFAVERNYGAIPPLESLARFGAGREALVGFMRALEEEQWDRVGLREGLGPATIFGQAALALGHDSYHLRQTAEWLAAGR